MNLDSRKRFLQLKTTADRHRDIVVTEGFLRACEIALVEYGAEEGGKPDGSMRIKGAHDIIHKLLNIAEEPKPVGRLPSQNLNHTLS